MKNVNIKLRNIKSSPAIKQKENFAYDTFKYVYINRTVFNPKTIEKSESYNYLFLKTVLKKAFYFYEIDNCKKMYEWVFKFRNYIKLLDMNNDITSNIYLV